MKLRRDVPLRNLSQLTGFITYECLFYEEQYEFFMTERMRTIDGRLFRLDHLVVVDRTDALLVMIELGAVCHHHSDRSAVIGADGRRRSWLAQVAGK